MDRTENSENKGDSAAPATKRRHNKALQIRMTAELLDLVHFASERAGLSTSGWVRDRLMRVARRELRNTEDDTPRRKYRGSD